MLDKTVIAAAALGAGAVIVYDEIRTYEMPILDPAVFRYTQEEVRGMLASARTALSRRDGDGQIQIWGAGRSVRGVKLNMQYASQAPLLQCEAVVTAIAADRSHVIADCGGNAKGDSALGRTEDALRTPMFEEHIQATLNKRAFKRENATQKEALIVFKNLGGMQREALQRSDEARRAEAKFNR